ncbi:cob(I)yrinic acid a,c-diamide adenosyltransferase [Lactobacillus sp. PFC-70]|uniref:Corrinoid adenosyltransferase n=1 Tax=Levilactobacillus namurensis TaxID=380393 RepID=A0AAW8W6G5_9LACO|nr:cob(I)yrinic acid a,c-diamide adenosyltransferase [Levilactobacillus namurensis]PTM23888.1 cob(I)yrinic acid a,c-diamide adenosyltransferase [Lactobacillus sp. PFC-70]MCW3777539.1 cob(I)yrinic acid a,c-diamide adenosyltransferase [Levilactobacillus namurensis]MDT7014333.1 cob(I)yrinic acid a,c-diamide adenosyltransferase [Levilactobacillus namurensis]MDT7018739.1 cob(I)yrinic acid a,c-diamide adenosyltransferase [Levilactobacillus namurensis]WNN66638.1 cob(I)yrinic acid a,c-diamide adenosyl
MPIYTKGGDKGTTSLYDGQRVKKDSLRVETYGTFDELNANISLADKLCVNPKNKAILQRVEYKMFFLQGEIATQNTQKFLENSRTISDDDVHELEQIIDHYTTELPKVTSFILPGASLAGAQLHICRTVCRRAERQFVRFSTDTDVRPVLERYINRLSDFMYIMARSEDHEAYVQQVTNEVLKRYAQAVGR